ncbi:hypothetical protein [Caballeronia sp. TF1N1]|uniref:hypothetical protein n=1 Tax=Caballeronia sp. TF1N1 TaxID=2878153 RepID=UPI001FD421BD|nr:hypothetical protein [Caballeronia sp. TF1N1]
MTTLVGAFNALNLYEAFGSGPPYYSLTTNMDKWSSPVPMLALVDAVAIAITAIVLLLLKRGSRRSCVTPPQT